MGLLTSVYKCLNVCSLLNSVVPRVIFLNMCLSSKEEVRYTCEQISPKLINVLAKISDFETKIYL